MKKYGLLLLLSPLCMFAMETEVSDEVILGASYLIYKGHEKALLSEASPNEMMYNMATFYTAQGDEIKTVQGAGRGDLKNLLDPEAPKPQPMHCSIWDVEELIENDWKKSIFLVFKDKNDNHIKSYPYVKTTQKVTIVTVGGEIKEVDLLDGFDELDLTIIQGKDPQEVEEAPWVSGRASKICSVQ